MRLMQHPRTREPSLGRVRVFCAISVLEIRLQERTIETKKCLPLRFRNQCPKIEMSQFVPLLPRQRLRIGPTIQVRQLSKTPGYLLTFDVVHTYMARFVRDLLRPIEKNSRGARDCYLRASY